MLGTDVLKVLLAGKSGTVNAIIFKSLIK
jgi:hypothetical protein